MWIRFEATRVKRLPQFHQFRQAMGWDSYQALGFLGFFWNTVLEVSETGDVSGWTPAYCAELLGLRDEIAEKAWAALLEGSFLTRQAAEDGGRLLVAGWVSDDMGGPLAAYYLRGRYKDKGEAGKSAAAAIWAIHGQPFGPESRRKAKVERFHEKTASIPDAVPSRKRVENEVHSIAEHSRAESLNGVSAELAPPTSAPPSDSELEFQDPRALPRLDAITDPPVEQPLLVFPCAGSRPEWPLYQAKVDAWRLAYPAVDVLGECRKALAWVECNLRQKKTYQGMPAFINRWLAKEQDRGGRGGSNAGRAANPASAPGRGNAYDSTVKR